MGGLIDIEWKWCELNIHDHDRDLWVTMVGVWGVRVSDMGDFRCQHVVNIFSRYYDWDCEITQFLWLKLRLGLRTRSVPLVGTITENSNSLISSCWDQKWDFELTQFLLWKLKLGLQTHSDPHVGTLNSTRSFCWDHNWELELAQFLLLKSKLRLQTHRVLLIEIKTETSNSHPFPFVEIKLETSNSQSSSFWN